MASTLIMSVCWFINTLGFAYDAIIRLYPKQVFASITQNYNALPASGAIGRTAMQGFA